MTRFASSWGHRLLILLFLAEPEIAKTTTKLKGKQTSIAVVRDLLRTFATFPAPMLSHYRLPYTAVTTKCMNIFWASSEFSALLDFAWSYRKKRIVCLLFSKNSLKLTHVFLFAHTSKKSNLNVSFILCNICLSNTENMWFNQSRCGAGCFGAPIVLAEYKALQITFSVPGFRVNFTYYSLQWPYFYEPENTVS